jgi:alkylation response protein AidB-like acyl-CoA dehydrogenase
MFYSRENLDFILNDVIKVNDLTRLEYFNAHDAETIKMTLDTAHDIAEKILYPNYTDADRNSPNLVNGEIKLHPAFIEFFNKNTESGLMTAAFPFEWEGQQMPKTVTAAVEFIYAAANNSFVTLSDLSMGCANLILSFGNDDLKELYGSKILEGKWAGTMCLTEPNAGSGLSDLVCAARPDNNNYKIKGTKIFITNGDHDATENIVHLVLARIEGAPKGTKGISLFVVPKKRIENETLVSNNVTSVAAFHKMGQKAATTMHLDFGDKDDCIGYMVGEPHKGLTYMFQMMNSARLNVGLNGVSTASAAYYASLQYAKERKQGKRLNNKIPDSPQVSIIEHPDVRRLLLSQKSFVEGTLAFILRCYKYLDLEKTETNIEQKKHYNSLLEMLTPVAKTIGAEGAFKSINNGLQVFGGYGFTVDFPLEQMVRDSRIFSIYEGTSAIQGQAILGRQIPLNNGEIFKTWLNVVYEDIKPYETDDKIGYYVKVLKDEIQKLIALNNKLLSIASTGDFERFLANATLYIDYFSLINLGWHWIILGGISNHKITAEEFESNSKEFFKSKIKTMEYFFEFDFKNCDSLRSQIESLSQITIYDESNEILI